MKDCFEMYRDVLEKGFRPSKGLGQNFLIDNNVREIILKAAAVTDNENILEIGAGNGVLSSGLLDRGAQLWVIERDHRFCLFLNELFGHHPHFHLMEGDALKMDLQQLPPRKLVSNLPYSIISPLLYKLWREKKKIQEMVIMMQLEVAMRLISPTGSNGYSSLTVLYRLTHRTEIIHRVSKNCFRPTPRVDSAVVKLTWLGSSLGKLEKPLKSLVEMGFKHRRKKLVNSLSLCTPQIDWTTLLEKLQIPLTARAQELSPKEWLELAKIVVKEKPPLLPT